MTKQIEMARTARAATGRHLIAAGIISPRVDVRITQAGVTGVLRKGARR